MKTVTDTQNNKYKGSQFYDILERKNRNIPQKQLDIKLEFEKEIGLIDTLNEIKKELINETKEIHTSIHTHQAVEKYFLLIQEHILKRVHYRDTKKRLDYLLLRRFLWTTLNNLNEIDIQIITPHIRKLSNNLREMAKTYNDFIRKTKYLTVAYEEVFLDSQENYTSLNKSNENIVQEMRKLKVSEEYLASSLAKKKEEIKRNNDIKKRQNLQIECKVINGTYVDIIHIISVLKEKYNENQHVIQKFKNRYSEEFNELFTQTAFIYEKTLVDILGAQAFELDMLLWEQAEKSASIKLYFLKAGIKGAFNTKTYLQYYLESNDYTKASEEKQKLFELYEYLNTIYLKHIIIVTNSTDDAIEFKRSIELISKEYKVHSFIDEKAALKLALQNIVEILILSEELKSMSCKQFLLYYQKYSFFESKLIFLGSQNNIEYNVFKSFSKDIFPNALAKNVQKFL